MTGDSTDKRPPGERPRRGARREPAVLDLKADSVETAPATQAPLTDPEASGVSTASAASPDVATSVDPELESRPADVAHAEAALAGEAVATDAVHETGEAGLPATSRDSETVQPDAFAATEAATAGTADAVGPAGGDGPSEPTLTSVPPVGPSMRTPRTSLLGPALAGLAAGFVGAGLLTVGFLLFGPAGDIGDRLAGLETAVGERASRRTVEALEKRVGGLDGTAASLRGDVDAVGRKLQEIPADLPALFGRVDRIERNVADLAAQPRAAQGQASAPAPQPPPLVAARESAVLAIALLLRDALDRGAPYGRELEALQSAGVPAETIAALQPFAASGAPGAPGLARDFAGLAERIANPPPPPPRSVSDRVTATFSGLFKVRPVGEAEGDSPAALAARTEALLQRGALKDAAAALDRIPPDDAAPAQDFRGRLKARIAASDAAAAILSKAVDELLAAARLQGATR